MSEHLLTCPLHVMISSRKKWHINLNSYRNAHFQVLSKAKREFHSIMKQQVLTLPPMELVEMSYLLFWRGSGRCDTRNICTIVDKFLMDVIVTLGRLPDDDYKHDLEAKFRFGGIDRVNPRVEAYVKEVA